MFNHGTEICDNCGCYRNQVNDGYTYNHPDTGIVTFEPSCPPTTNEKPALYNGQNKITEIKAGEHLSGKYLGIMEWGIHVNVPTMNVYHEWHKGPVATFHHALAINFKSGVSWFPEDMQALLELHAQWRALVELNRETKTNDNDKDQRITNQ